MLIMDASWLSVIIISFTLFFTCIYWFYILLPEKAKPLALITATLASLILTFIMIDGFQLLAPFGGLVIVLLWLLPSCLAWKYRDYFKGLDQRKLIGLQIFRLIGALFILEMSRGLIPASFAIPAGIGDLVVGSLAAFIFLTFRQIPRFAVLSVTFLGMVDFLMALSFGILSSPGPLQVFALGEINQTNLFPTGMIPFFLVPYALVNHQLSLINLPKK